MRFSQRKIIFVKFFKFYGHGLYTMLKSKPALMEKKISKQKAPRGKTSEELGNYFIKLNAKRF